MKGSSFGNTSGIFGKQGSGYDYGTGDSQIPEVTTEAVTEESTENYGGSNDTGSTAEPSTSDINQYDEKYWETYEFPTLDDSYWETYSFEVNQ